MNAASLVRLVALGAIWGGSFIFLRVLAPVFGPVLTANLRLLIGGLTLLAYFRAVGFDVELRKYWKKYLFIGTVNSALPFFLFAFAAQYIPASYSAILNSTAPLFGAMFSAAWLGDTLTPRKISGLALGALGVSLVTGAGPVNVLSGSGNEMFVWAVAACLIGALSYGFSAVFIKKYAVGIKPMAMAGASQFMAGLVLLPAVPFYPMRSSLTSFVILNMLALALLCSGVAYLLYFRLIADLGPTRALTVTFLMPVFGIIWAILFLGEKITSSMILGCFFILVGTGLVLLTRSFSNQTKAH
jgi:drug/metabolite transporter (DMT)-like permease